MDSLGVAVSIISPEGVLLYYNRQAEALLDRKPEYINRDIFGCHEKEATNVRIREMLDEFKNGRTDPIHYQARPYGSLFNVTLAPVIENGNLKACVHSVVPDDDT